MCIHENAQFAFAQFAHLEDGMRHEGVGYSLLGSDTAVCGILVGEKAESQRSHSGGT